MIQDYQNIIANLTLVQLTLLVSFIVVFVLRLMYLFLFTARVCFDGKRKSENDKGKPITLVFTLRNEEENIKKNLPQLLEIEGVDFEVVAIDDYSQDNTLSLLGLYKQRYSNLKISSLSQETRFSIKLAQNIALKSASNDWILVVPVSMENVSKEWLKHIVSQLEKEDTNLLIAYSCVSVKKGAFNLLYRIENFYQQLTSAAYIYNGVPFIYSEDNIAFKKEKYFELGGYGKNIKEPYANLELLVNNFIKKRTTQISYTKETNISKEIETGKAEFLDLLNKSIRIEKHLPFAKKLVLFTDRLTALLFLPLLALNLVLCFKLLLLVSIPVIFIVLSRMLIIKMTLNRLNERKIFIPSLVYGLLMPYYKMIYRWRFGKASQNHKWNKGV